MRKDLTKRIDSSFLSCEKDLQLILKKLFLEYPEHAEALKRLLIIGTKDCLDMSNLKYKEIVDRYSIKDMIDQGYIRRSPKIQIEEHEEIKSYIVISFDDFTLNDTNPEFRDCTISFDIICHLDYWDIGNFRLRPLMIAGYIDGILNGSRLSGIG